MKRPSFPFYVNNWLASARVSAMTPAEEGAYIRLLAYEWNDPDCSLPDDDPTLAALSRLGPEWNNGSGKKIRACFIQSGNRLVSERLQMCRIEVDEFSEHQRNRALKRWHPSGMPGHSRGIADVIPDRCSDSDSESDLDSDAESEKDTPLPPKGGLCAEPAKTPTLAPHKRVTFNAESGRLEGLLDSDHAYLSEAFPAVDCRLAISAASAWLLANPTKRKKNNWRFLVNWCAKCQERGGNKSARKEGKPWEQESSASRVCRELEAARMKGVTNAAN